MKTCVCCISILLSIFLLSCSKPVEPTVKPIRPVVKPEKEKYTLESREITPPAVVDEELPEPKGYQVTVLDAVSGEPVDHAVVNLKWHINWEPFTLDAVNMGDGRYIICTNKNFGIYYVGIVAEGYLPDNYERGQFPLTVRLKRGETVKVYGTVYDFDGNSISGAYIAARPLNGTIWTNDEWRMVYSCETYSGGDGYYEMPTVPKFLDRLFIRFKHNEYAMLDFTNQIFNTFGKDECVDIVLPEFLELEGQVSYDTGEPAEGARVWVQNHTSAHADSFIRATEYSRYLAAKNCSTITDSNGCFLIRMLDVNPYYAVKAATDMHLPSMAGIFTSDNPAPDFIHLTIQSEGSRMYGRFSDAHGSPVTNVDARYTLVSVTSSRGAYQKINFEVDDDGNYLSQIVNPGRYSISYNSPGYKVVSKEVSVQKDGTTLTDVVFPQTEIINGIVINPLNSEPIPGVVLVNVNQPSGSTAEFSPQTDGDGKFWIRPKSYNQIQFSHPDYGTATAYFSSERGDSNTIQKIYLSRKTTVAVRVDGVPPEKDRDYTVTLQHQPSGKNDLNIGWNRNNRPFYARSSLENGTAVFTNVPIHCSPVVALLNTLDGRSTLSRSEPQELIKDDTTHISLAVPAMGTLVVVLAHPYRKNEYSFQGTPIRYGSRDRKSRQIYSPISIHSGCEIGVNELIWLAVVTNAYTVSFRTLEKPVYSSNIVIRAGETTKIFIDFKTNAYGSIRGTTSLADSTPIDCVINVRSSGKDRVKSARSRNGDFIVKYLDPDNTYSLIATYAGIGQTNITVENVSPGDTPVAITLGSAYRISGNLVDGQGIPLSAKVMAARYYSVGPGNFSLFPAFPGTHRVVFDVKGYTPVVKEVTVTSSDVDLGDIVCYDKGYTLSGTVVTSEGSPAPRALVILNYGAGKGSKSTRTGPDGTFTIKNLAEDNKYTLVLRHGRERLLHPIENITSDTNLGELKLESIK